MEKGFWRSAGRLVVGLIFVVGLSMAQTGCCDKCCKTTQSKQCGPGCTKDCCKGGKDVEKTS